MHQATFAAGCFWGVEAKFRRVPGVIDACVGYTGGHLPDPTYPLVCTGETGHAEAITVQFDPNVVSYEDLLLFFWSMHDPTTHHRQGPDIGSQYRSAVFYHDSIQFELATALKAKLNQTQFQLHPIVTEIEPAGVFYPAEAYHQRYLEKQQGML